MFENFYKLSGLPFQLTPDPKFFFGSAGHSRAISHLVYGLAQQEGFIVITGEVGAGKTTLVEQLWSLLDRNTYVMAKIVTTQLSGDDLLRLAMGQFRPGETRGVEKATLLRWFENMVRDYRKQGKRCLLVVDEVQNLSLEAIEELRMLSNFIIDGRAAVQTILVGQPQFRRMLAARNLEQLRQRVLASFHLGPLTEAETRGYIEHRLRTVGWVDDPVWEDGAFAAVHRASGGIPRRINTLCSRVLLFGALEDLHRVTAVTVDETAAELRRDVGDPEDPDANEPDEVSGSGTDSAGLILRIEALERRVTRQDAVSRRILDLLEAGVTGVKSGAAT